MMVLTSSEDFCSLAWKTRKNAHLQENYIPSGYLLDDKNFKQRNLFQESQTIDLSHFNIAFCVDS